MTKYEIAKAAKAPSNPYNDNVIIERVTSEAAKAEAEMNASYDS